MKLDTLNSSIEKYNLIITPQSKCISQVLDILAQYFSQPPCKVTKPNGPGTVAQTELIYSKSHSQPESSCLVSEHNLGMCIVRL